MPLDAFVCNTSGNARDSAQVYCLSHGHAWTRANALSDAERPPACVLSHAARPFQRKQRLHDPRYVEYDQGLASRGT